MTGVNLSITTYTSATNTADVSTTAGAAAALTVVKAAIVQLSNDRASVGANVSRLSSTEGSWAFWLTISPRLTAVLKTWILPGKARNTLATTSWSKPARQCSPRPTLCGNQSSDCSSKTLQAGKARTSREASGQFHKRTQTSANGKLRQEDKAGSIRE